MGEADWAVTAIDGVMRRQSEPIADERGSFAEAWRASWTAGAGELFVQANLSRSRAGVLRGMHFHLRQVDLWVLLEGRAVAATTDLRPFMDGGDDRIVSQLVEMTPGTTLIIPRRVAHGFVALEDSVLLYLVSNEYDGTDEHGFAWDDPLAAIAWPAGSPILSTRDQANPSLQTLRSTLRILPETN